MSGQVQARLSLLALLAAVGAGVVLGLPGWRGGQATVAGQGDLLAGGPEAGAAWSLARLQAWQRRRPSRSEWQQVQWWLRYGSWELAWAALRVMSVHGHPQLSTARVQLLRRLAADGLGRSPADGQRPGTRPSRQRALTNLLAELGAGSAASCRRELVRVLERAREGRTRARAFRLLAGSPPTRWPALVQRALQDPSQRVRLAALDEIGRRGWTAMANAVRPLLDCPRPLVQRRAQAVLARLGHPVPSDAARRGATAAMQAAQALAQQLWAAGLRPGDVLPASEQAVGRIDERTLARQAEAYLDRVGDCRVGALPTGVLLLAVAVRAGNEKQVRRLWEALAAASDTDHELLQAGLSAIAAARLRDAQRANRACLRLAGQSESAITSLLRR